MNVKSDVKCDVCDKDIVLGQIWRRLTADDGRSLNVHRDCTTEAKRILTGENE